MDHVRRGETKHLASYPYWRWRRTAQRRWRVHLTAWNGQCAGAGFPVSWDRRSQLVSAAAERPACNLQTIRTYIAYLRKVMS